MDASSFDQADLDRLSPQDKQELRQFINNEQQKAQIQQRSHELTEMCFKKCVTGAIKSNAVDKGEQSCLASCVDRFMDASLLSVKHLQSMRHT
ncbi:Tim10/DDP family zinc finger-domain-containing protein [Coniella lustricola]|uniref:Mitochondrial import inner membrane translocase subunit n=1 Tax=Coniella lustricola TaxID=2025994 RepID=A0A2T3ABA2_9PEZI|nr:Tim10/DDP family zinc finger-domain-containing protein [Coniella lustricola]